MKLTLTVKFVIERGKTATLSSEFLPITDAKALYSQMKKQSHIASIQLEDEYGVTWTEKELHVYLDKLQEEPHDVTVLFDGGFDVSTKKAGVGVVIYYSLQQKRYRKRVNTLLDYLEDNNEAEYAALYFAIQQMDEIGIHHQDIVIQGDSMQVIHQMNDEWPVIGDVYQNWCDRIEHAIQQLGLKPIYELLPRSQNKQADKLATQALEGNSIDAVIQLEGE